MSDLIHNLGIDWKLLIAQLINFAILFFVLRRFAFRPLLALLDKRREKVVEGERVAAALAAAQAAGAVKAEEVLAYARKESTEIIVTAKKDAVRLRESLEADAKREVGKILAEGERRLQEAKVRVEAELQKELGAVVLLAAERAVGDVLDDRARERLSASAFSALEKALPQQ